MFPLGETNLIHLWRFEGVFICEMHIEEEDAAFVHRTRWSQDGRHPLVQVVSLWPSTESKICHKVRQLERQRVLERIRSNSLYAEWPLGILQ